MPRPKPIPDNPPKQLFPDVSTLTTIHSEVRTMIHELDLYRERLEIVCEKLSAFTDHSQEFYVSYVDTRQIFTGINLTLKL